MTVFHKKLLAIFPVISVFFFVPSVFAAGPDGLGPWADNVVSTSQGLMKNGLAVPAIRSNSAAAVGVAENNNLDGNFYSLGFGGNIILGFNNGISSGVFVVEATNPRPLYPLEKAKVEVSENGTTWMTAGNVSQDGTVSVPESINCAKFVRITDISGPASDYPDDTADGYDVDGAQAIGDSCTPTSSPTPNPSQSPAPSPSGSSDSGSSTSTSTSTTASVPGFPNTGGPTCSTTEIKTIPNITQARRESPTSIFVSWGPNGGLNDFVVNYGFQANNLQFSTKVSGFSTIIGNLPTNQPIWIQVAATDNCSTGKFGTAVLVGGTPQTNTPGFPNTGNRFAPRLPNTGIDPETTSWDISNIVQSVLNFFQQAFGN